MKNPFARLKQPPAAMQYSAGAATDPTRLTPQQVSDAVKGRAQGEPYIRPQTWNKETEDEWAETVYTGKIARNIITLAKNTMAATLTSDNPETKKMCEAFGRKLRLLTTLQQIRINWDKYGRVYIYPVWTTKKDLEKIKLLYPPTVAVYRNGKKDIEALQEKLKAAKLPAVSVSPGSGDEIIGYLQTIGDQTWYFGPQEIINIPRYPDGQRPDGYSLLVQTADIISAKLQIETDQVIMASRHGDPKHIFHIPAAWWQPENADKLEQFKNDMKNGFRAGDDMYLATNAADPDENVTVELLEATGNPVAVIKSQDHAENQFIASFGLADSFTESESSNRSVGEIQLAFFERDIAADRIMFAEILESKLIDPWLKANGKAEGSAWFEFADLTPDDRLKKLQILAPQFPYLDPAIVDQVLEQAGYTISSDERPAPMTAATDMRRYGITAEYSRLRGIKRTEAQLIRAGRDAITEQVEAHKARVRELVGRQ